VDFLTKELGFSSAFNYKKEGYAEALKRLAPDGIDIYYDNVGGDALDAALAALRLHGRIGMSGVVYITFRLGGDNQPANAKTLYSCVWRSLAV